MTQHTHINTATTYRDLGIVITPNVGMPLKCEIECMHVSKVIAPNERMSI